jgi:hypothetical protein
MIRYAPYPIIINGSYLDEAARALAPLAQSIGGIIGIDLKAALLSNVNRLDYVVDDSPQAKGYEETVRRLLACIGKTAVGMALFRCLPRHIPVWIIPYDSQIQKNFDPRNAVTDLVAADVLEGVKIRYSPELWSVIFGHPYSPPDEVLFHELVHACRYAVLGRAGLKRDPVPDNTDYEEFLALQLQNVYRWQLGVRKLRHNYDSATLGTQEEVERTLWSSDAAMKALEYFRLVDPLVKLSVRTATGYNPFRDLDRLKKKRQDWLNGRR